MGARVVALLLATLAGLASVAASADPIQPGDRLTGGCALNFVYRSHADAGPHAGKLWIGTAAGCVALGERVAVEGGPTFGTVVYVGDQDEEQNGIPGLQQDFALIEVDAEHRATVSPAVKGLGALPRGFVATPLSTSVGERLLLPPTDAGVPREGRLVQDDDFTFRAVLPGDVERGAPVVVASSGRALGSVSGLRVTCCTGGVPVPAHEGPTALRIVTELGMLGWPIELQRAS